MPLTAEVVHHQLRHAARRLRWARFTRWLLAGLAASLVLLLVFLSCDAWLHLGRLARWAGFCFFLLPSIAGFVMAWRAARPTISDASMARRLERAVPGARNELINAVMFNRELDADSPMRSALFSEMSNVFPRVNWSSVLNLQMLRRIAGALSVTVTVLFVWAVVKPKHFNNSLARILLPSSNIAPITRTRIERVAPGDTQVTHGRKLAISAELGGSIPNAVWLYFRVAGGAWQHELMDREVGATTFTHERNEVRQPTEYYIAAGDSQSPNFQVTVRPKTVVAKRSVEIQPPAYTHLSKTIVKDAATLANLLPGSQMTTTLEFNSALEELQVTDDAGAKINATKISDTRYQFGSLVKANGTYKTRFCDTALVYDTDTIQYSIKIDEPPKITITAPAQGSEIQAAPTDTAMIRFTATDDFSLASVALYRSTDENPAAELLREWKDAAGQRSFSGQAEIPLSKYAKEDRVTFCLVAKDANDVAAAPGSTTSRPIVVTLRSVEKLAEQAKEAKKATQKSFDDLIRLQESNLAGTRTAVQAPKGSNQELGLLVDRQIQIAELGRTLAGSGDQFSLEARQAVRELSEKEMPAAVNALRTAAAATDTAQTENLLRGVQFESLILARLKGTAAAANTENGKALVRDAISGLEELNKRQREILTGTKAADAKTARTLSDKQDDLSTRATQVRKDLEKTSKDPAAGDADFRKRVTTVIAQFGQFRVYEDMLTAADKLQSADFTAATTTEQNVVLNISKLIAILSEWQLAAAQQEADKLREVAKNIAEKLAKLKDIQQQIVNKTKEVSRKDESKPEDIATSEQIRDLKDLMAAAVEKMLTDAEIFPDIPNANEMRSVLAEIFEDVQQADLDDVRNNKKKVTEIAVQKEDAMLKGFDEAQKKTEEMEEWLPNTSNSTKWLLENFDTTQFPNMPQTPLPEAYTDLVGKLLEKQKDIQDKMVDSASNQFLPSAPVGWEVRDGQQGTLGGQGKSGNEAPKHNEQSGRSSGGREGMSNGEMVGDSAQSLEGDKADVRRTNDGFQAGHVQDDGKVGETRATGGGKAGGFSDRQGFEGNGPVRAVNAQERAAASAAAVQQALLAEKAAKTYAQASMLYLKADGLPEVTRLMTQSSDALKAGRIQDFKSINRRIVGRLTELKSGINTQQGVVTMKTADAARAADQQLISGNEGEAPTQYKDAVADYYRSLLEAK